MRPVYAENINADGENGRPFAVTKYGLSFLSRDIIS
jgi:hypothetical protein